jgi:hypothetical protein
MSNTVSVDLSPIVRAIDQLSTQVNGVAVEVGGVRSDVADTKFQLDLLRRRFEEYVQQAELTANVQRSETKLSGLKDDLDRAFGHYRVVRRTTIGILQAFDVGNVSNTTVTQVSEELMIQSPRYWLAPAIVALAGWSKQDEHIVTISVQEAFQRDPRKASLFFALVLRRQGRPDDATRWLRHYLTGLDPRGLGREFAIIFEAIAQGAFGPGANTLVAERVGEWNAILRQDAELVDAQVERWRGYVATRRQHLDRDDLPKLRRFSPDFDYIESQLESASALPEAIIALEATRDRPSVSAVTVEDLLDDILESLVTEYDVEELPLRREIAYHEAVVEENGDLDRARERAETVQGALTETTDVLTLQTMMAIQPDDFGVSAKTQQLALGTSRNEVESGIVRFTNGYRGLLRSAIRIELDPQHTGSASAFGFAGWSTGSDVAEAAAIVSLREAWEATFRSYIEAQRFRPTKYIVAGGISGAVMLLSFVIGAWPLGLIILLVGGGIIGGLAWRAVTKAKAAIAKLEGVREQAVDESVLLYRSVMAEYLEATLQYSDLDEQEPELLQLVRSWPVGMTPKEETK